MKRKAEGSPILDPNTEARRPGLKTRPGKIPPAPMREDDGWDREGDEPEADIGEISHYVKTLEGLAGAIKDSLIELEHRISPVLTQYVDVKELDDPQKQANTEMGGKLQSLIDDLQQIDDKVSDIRGRVQI